MSVRSAHLAWLRFCRIPRHLVAGEIGMESQLTPPPSPYFLGRQVGADTEAVLLEAQLPGRLPMRRCLPARLGRTLEGHYRPQRSWFGDGKLGFRPREVVDADNRLVNISENSMYR